MYKVCFQWDRLNWHVYTTFLIGYTEVWANGPTYHGIAKCPLEAYAVAEAAFMDRYPEANVFRCNSLQKQTDVTFSPR